MSVVIDYAGAERVFHLRLGDIMDLEQACGGVGFGAIYKRLHAWDYFAGDVMNIVRLGLVGGGMAVAEAKKLVTDRFDILPLDQHVNIALKVLLDAVEGAPKAKADATSDPVKPIDVGSLLADFAKLGIAPEQVREMRFADVLRIYEASGKAKPDDAAPSDDAIAAMEARVASGALDWSLKPAPTTPE